MQVDKMSSSGGVVLLNSILQSAKKTFSRNLVRPGEGLLRLSLPAEEFSQHLAHLRHLVSKVKAADLGLERSKALTRDFVAFGHNRNAPVTYIGIYEDRDISVGIFIIGRGCRIPLHNHPGMHGILKVVHGQIEVASYTKLRPEQVETPDVLQQRLRSIDSGRIFPAKKQQLRAGVNSGSLLLRPDENNLHEIQAGSESSAAFLDILAPPYNNNNGHEDENFEFDLKRDCDFYSEIRNVAYSIPDSDGDGGSMQTITWLEKQVDAPDDYFCDSEDFLVDF